MNSQNQSRQDFYKIVLKFYRRLAIHPDARNSDFPFLIFGYFDALSINPVLTLDDFYNDIGNKINTKHQNYEIYRLCLYSQNNNLNGDRNIFEKIENAPLIVISEVKLNTIILEKNNNTLDEIRDFIRKSIKSKIDELNDKKTQFSIFSSLGFSDFVIVFRGDEYQRISNLIFYTRNLDYNLSSNSLCKLLRSSYSISGVHYESINKIDPQKENNVSIRFSQISSCGQEEIIAKIRKALKLKEEEDKVNTVFGKYDLELYLKNFPLIKIMSLYKPGGILDPQGKLHRKYLGHTNTHWLFEYQDDQDRRRDSQKDYSKLPKLKIDLANIQIEGIKKAFYQLVQNFYQLERNDASDQSLIDELRNIILDFYHQGEENLKRINEIQGKEKYLDLKEHYNDMQIGLEIITQLLNSRVQAFRFYSEIPSYDIQFVRSATKLYLMYMNIVTNIERKLGKDNINIFVTLGYFGTVKQDVFFPATKKSLVAINLGINSFFKIPYNILLLFHEISHSIPPFDIKALYNEIIISLCNSLASLITARVFSGDAKLDIKPIYPYSEENYKSMRKALSSFIYKNISGLRYSKDLKTDKLITDFWNNFQSFSAYYDESVLVAWNQFVEKWNTISERYVSNPLVYDLDQTIYRLKDFFECGEDFGSIEELFINNLGHLSDKQLCTEDEKESLEQRWENLINKFKMSKEKVITQWSNFIYEDWSPTINEINEKIPSQLPNYSILDHFLQCNVLEGTEINSRELAKKILLYINANKEKLFENIKKCEKLINEFLADYYMCYILELKRDIYLSMINLYVKENGTLIDVTELEYRKTMMEKSHLFSSVVNLNNKSQIQSDIDRFLDSLGFEEFEKKINENIQSKKYPKHVINSDIIENLRNYYNKLDQNSLDEKRPFEKDADLIESLYSLTKK